MIRTTTRHRATAIEVNVMALLMRPLFLSGKLQLIEVMFCAVKASRMVQFDCQHCCPSLYRSGFVQKHWIPNRQAENCSVMSEVQLAVQSDTVDDWPSTCCERQSSANQATTVFHAIFKVWSACRALRGQKMEQSSGRTQQPILEHSNLFKIAKDKLAPAPSLRATTVPRGRTHHVPKVSEVTTGQSCEQKIPW